MLAEKLGMTVAELGRRMQWSEFENWKLYYEKKQEINEQEAKDAEREAKMKSKHGRG